MIVVQMRWREDIRKMARNDKNVVFKTEKEFEEQFSKNEHFRSREKNRRNRRFKNRDRDKDRHYNLDY